MKGWKGVAATAAIVVTLMGARPAQAAYLEDMGWGTLTVLTNVLYMPVKIVYATLGGLTGGLAYGLTAGDMQTAETVWVTSMGGNYVVTPGMLRGEESLSFAGTPGGSGSGTPAPAVTDARPLDEQPLGGS